MFPILVSSLVNGLGQFKHLPPFIWGNFGLDNRSFVWISFRMAQKGRDDERRRDGTGVCCLLYTNGSLDCCRLLAGCLKLAKRQMKKLFLFVLGLSLPSWPFARHSFVYWFPPQKNPLPSSSMLFVSWFRRWPSIRRLFLIFYFVLFFTAGSNKMSPFCADP